MADFVVFEPEHHGTPNPEVIIRSAADSDNTGIANVMATRGGRHRDHLADAQRMVDRCPLLTVATLPSGEIVGWSGASQHPLTDGGRHEWLVAGLTIIPDHRRTGIGQRLLTQVITELARTTSDSALYSVVNAANLASLALHRALGFREVDRGPTFAGITFSGGSGVLLHVEASA